MGNMIRRGLTYYARYRVLEDRWADLGVALGAVGGLKREVVRTLKTTDAREAKRRCGPVLLEIQAALEQALRKAGKRPLSDWTVAWMDRAVAYRADIETRGAIVHGHMPISDDWEEPEAVTLADITRIAVETDVDAIAAKRGLDAAAQYLAVALGEGLTVADGLRRWLATQTGKRWEQTIKGYGAAFGKLEAYLKDRNGYPSL